MASGALLPSALQAAVSVRDRQHDACSRCGEPGASAWHAHVSSHSVIQTDGMQRVPVPGPSAPSALPTVGWFFRAHVHRSSVSEAGLRPGQIAAQRCRNQASAPVEDTHCCQWDPKETLSFCLSGNACIFPSTEREE